MAMTMRKPMGLRTPLASRSRAVHTVVCQAQREEASVASRMALPVATLVAASLLSGAAIPEAALAAKSGGRAGGSSGFAARSSARSSTAPRTVVNNTTVYSAPPVVAPVYSAPVYSGGFGFGGFSIMPTFVMPFPFFGGLFQFFALIMIVSVVFSIIRSLGGSNNNANKKDDGWGDL